MLSIFLDMETTGLDATKHRAIDIALKVVDVPTNVLKLSYQSLISLSEGEWMKHDPTSLLVNGYTWEEVKLGQEPAVVGKEIIELFTELGVARGKAVFICQNPAFDRSFFTQLVDVYTQERLNWPYHWLDLASMYWACLVQNTVQKGLPFPDEINLSKNSIAKHYNMPPEAVPHRAMNGVDHLIACYHAVLG